MTEPRSKAKLSMSSSDRHPRFVPEEPFPSYSYVPGYFPHPLSDSAGHMAGRALPKTVPCNPDDWSGCRQYLLGIDLFNHGYYWEAHEAWESVWHAQGRRGATADFIKGLIKLAAAAVKAREGNAEGVRRHARRASELFRQLPEQLREAKSSRFFGLEPATLAHEADRIQIDVASRIESPNPELLLSTIIDPK